ncbi:MAG TPA: RHS repeat-associated core domain-containing protein [Archangium sp.]|nr:RHS repeat-associated core domain-containing protein [Archangium sp.]
MMPAVKHLDPVLGVDIHLIITPPGAVVPIPHPHIGIVFDPFDYLPIIGSTVNVNGLPRAQAGTGGIALPPHFPIGGAFLKPPGNDNETFMGSSTVLVDEEPFTHMLLPVLSCQDIGMPRPPRKKSKGGAKSLLLPTTVALSIPAGPPVIVGGPPTISLAGLAQQLALGALLKGLKKLRKLQKASRKMKALSDRLHRAAKKVMDKLKVGPRARNAVHKSLCTLTGHPVDVVTGRVVTEAVDWELPGPLPLCFGRQYSSSWGGRDSALGFGWSHSLELAVWEEEGRMVFRAEDGREIVFDTTGFPKQQMPLGAEVYEPIDRLTLRRLATLRWEVQTVEGLVHELRQVATGARSGLCRVVRTRNPAGYSITYDYDANGRLEWVVDSVGRRVRFEHDARGRLVRTWLPHPEQLGLVPCNRYVYSEAGDLVEVYDALEQVTRYAYAEHLLVRDTDRTGLSFYFEYDAQGPEAWCVRTWGDGGIYDHRLRYDKHGHLTEVTNSLGHTTTYQSDGRGVVVSRVDPLGGEWRCEYDAFLRRTSETDPLGNVTYAEYDERGNRTKVTEPDGTTLRFDHDKQGQVIRCIDELGGEWRWVRDRGGALIERLNPLGESLRYERRGALPVAIIDPSGVRSELQYDHEMNVARLREPDGTETAYSHDRWGRLVQIRRSDGSTWRLQYDLCDRPVRIEAPDGEVQVFVHDAEGNLLEERSAERQIRYTYTGFHWLESVHEPGGTVRMEYDSEAGLLGILNERGEWYRLVRDARGEVVEEHGFDGGIRRYERNLLGQVTRLQRAGGGEVQMEYDVAGQLVGAQYGDGSRARFVYRVDGRLLVAENEAAKVEFELDAVGRTLGECCNGHWVRSRYDARGNRVEVHSSCGLEGLFTFDSAGRLRTLTTSPSEKQGRSRRLDFVHDAPRRQSETVLPGGVRSRWEWDGMDRPEKRSISHESVLSEWRSYHWRPGEKLGEIVDSLQGRIRFQHDARSRLIATHFTDGRSQFRLQDAAGNLFCRADHRDRVYGRGNRLEASEGSRFEYDDDGNLTQRRLPDGSSWHYSYNGAGFLTQVLRPDSTRVSFTYDALGRRISKRIGDREITWIWDGENLLHELRDSSEPTSWVHAPGGLTPLVKLEGQAFFSIVHDHLETPEVMYDESGRRVWHASYDSYGAVGNIVEESPCPWRWPGQYEDVETGLYYNRFRYYDPSSGRYISPDPTGVDGGLNLYAYVGDPLVMVDPLGLDWNYVLIDANDKVYYVGRASDNQSLEDVKRRHNNTRGSDGRRFDPSIKDRAVQITDPGTPREVARGIEERMISNEKNGTNIGRRKDNGNRVRGNNIRGVRPSNPKRQIYKSAARNFLKRSKHCK